MSGPVSGTYVPGVSLSGIYTYSLSAIAPCTAATATVSVAQSTAPNAGDDAIATICTDQSPFSLNTLSTGMPNLNGSWYDPDMVAHINQFDPATDSAGVYTYVVLGISPCDADTATVLMQLVPTPNAGLNGNITVWLLRQCSPVVYWPARRSRPRWFLADIWAQHNSRTECSMLPQWHQETTSSDIPSQR